MSGRKKDERAVSIPEVKEIMEYVKEQMEEIDTEEGMSHFQEITYNYVNKFAKIDNKIAKKVKKFLMEKYDIEEIYAINIININPQSLMELRIILEKSFTGKTFTDKQLEIILEELEDIKSS
jgi:DNA-directed RNA polymerase subunit F